MSDSSFDSELNPGFAALVEDRLFEMTEDLPPLRSSLREELLIDLARVERQRQHRRRLSLILASVLFVAAGWLLQKVDGLALLTSPVATAAEQNWMTDKSDDDALNKLTPDVQAAAQLSDSWAVVDAFDRLRHERSSVLRQSYFRNTKYTAPQMQSDAQR